MCYICYEYKKQIIMKNELISMVEYISIEEDVDCDLEDSYYNIVHYKNFLNTILNPSQLIPCKKVGDKWEVLEMPRHYARFEKFGTVLNVEQSNKCRQYQTAKDNVIFEGLNIESVERLLLSCDIIEDLMDNYYRYVTLTKKGMELSGLNNK